MKKRLLCILLAAALVCSLSAAALADFGSEAGSIAASGFAELDGALYVADSYAGAVWRVSGSSLKLVAGGSGSGYADGDADDAVFSEPWALAPCRDGLLISDSGNALCATSTSMPARSTPRSTALNCPPASPPTASRSTSPTPERTPSGPLTRMASRQSS